jgi:hypothetical protein
VSDPRFKLKYVRFYFRLSNDAENDENLTKKIKDTLLRLYEYYIKVEDVEVVNDVETNRND